MLYGIIKFAEMVVFPSKTVLDLDQIPQILRNKLYRDFYHYYRVLKNIFTYFQYISFYFEMCPWRDEDGKDIIMVTSTVTSLRCLT